MDVPNCWNQTEIHFPGKLIEFILSKITYVLLITHTVNFNDVIQVFSKCSPPYHRCLSISIGPIKLPINMKLEYYCSYGPGNTVFDQLIRNRCKSFDNLFYNKSTRRMNKNQFQQFYIDPTTVWMLVKITIDISIVIDFFQEKVKVWLVLSLSRSN